MTSYSIEWKNSAIKELKKLPKPMIARVVHAVESLGFEPRPDGVRKLTGSENTYRIRVGDFRIVYNIFDQRLVVVIIRIRDRKDAYK